MRRPLEHSLDVPLGGESGKTFAAQVESTEASPADQMVRDELARSLEEAMESLPEMFQMVFRLAQVDGLKYRQISEILDIPVGTVKSRMSKAVRLLRSRLSSTDKREDSSGN